MKQLLAILLFPTIAIADCSAYGLYAFALHGCEEQSLGVNTEIPLCKQDQWRHLSYYDYRCYEALPVDYSRTDWEAPAPYERLWREPISGRVRTFPGSYQQADWEYRAARETIGILRRALEAATKKARKR